MKKTKITLGKTLRIHKRCLSLIRQAEPKLIPCMFCSSLVRAVLPYVIIFLSARILTELSGLRRPEELWKWVWLTIGCTAGGTVLKGGLEHLEQVYRERYEVQINTLFPKKFLTMDYADMDKAETHDLYSQIMQNENWFGWGVGILVTNLQKATEGFFGILSAAVLTYRFFIQKIPGSTMSFLNHPWLMAGIFILLVLGTCLGPVCENQSQKYWAKSDEECRMGNRIYNHFGFLHMDQKRAMDMRIYHQSELADRYLAENKAFSSQGKLGRYAKGPMGLWNALGKSIDVVMIGVIYGLVSLKAWAGAFGVGEVTQYIGAITALSGNIGLLIGVLGNLRNNVPFMENIYEFLDIPNAMYQGSLTTEKRSDRKYEVEFRDVSFRYPGSKDWTLRHVSMKFKIGQRLAIVGENGSGKTTFIKLLCRLYDPQEGEVLLNGIDIRKYNYRDYMQIFSVVFQDFQLLSQPLGNNVAGSMEYDREKAEKALLDAGFGDRLRELPLGLNTMLYKDLTQDGVEISGGEAQKIAIARALYKDAPFIILDEPTAALDPIAEAEIYAKFNDIAGDKTAIYISHRLSSCKFCDEIAVFKDGQVIQQGSHAQLLEDPQGEYFTLWNAQAQYYVEKA